MKVYQSFLFVLLIFLLFGCELNDSNDLTYQTIWYDKPAEKWEEALPLGNGRLGAIQSTIRLFSIACLLTRGAKY